MIGALFDIDGTITTRSTERIFLKWLIKKGHLSYFKVMVAFIRFLLSGKFRSYSDFKTNKMFYKSFSVSFLEELGRQCFHEEIKSTIRSSMRVEIQKCKSENLRTIFLSGSIESLVKPMVEYFEADGYICSRMAVDHGKYTGHLEGLHPYGIRKKKLAEKFAQESSVNLIQMACYANEWQDRHLMEVCGRPVAVAPDALLRKIAIEKRWEIIEA